MPSTTPGPPRKTAWRAAIALDGGTTNTRARWIDPEGRILATSRRSVGVRDTVFGISGQGPMAGTEDPDVQARKRRQLLFDAVREVIAQVDAAGEDDGVLPRPGLIVAAGMLSSEAGLTMVPHVEAPAGVDELADGAQIRLLPEISTLPILIIPGVRTVPQSGPDGWMAADVMRGEECETLGAYWKLVELGEIEPGQPGHVFLWPGSHTKLVELDAAGRITRSYTSLAGEFLQAIAQHTLVAASLPENLPDQLDTDASEAGGRAATSWGLARAAFLVRIAGLQGILDPLARASFWIGAVVAEDVIQLTRHPILTTARRIWIGGRQPLRELYTQRISRVDALPALALDEEIAESASAWGAIRIARARFEREVDPDV